MCSFFFLSPSLFLFRLLFCVTIYCWIALMFHTVLLSVRVMRDCVQLFYFICMYVLSLSTPHRHGHKTIRILLCLEMFGCKILLFICHSQFCFCVFLLHFSSSSSATSLWLWLLLLIRAVEWVDTIKFLHTKHRFMRMMKREKELAWLQWRDHIHKIFVISNFLQPTINYYTI